MAYPEEIKNFPHKENAVPFINPTTQLSADEVNYMVDIVNKNALFYGVHPNIGALEKAHPSPKIGGRALLQDGTEYKSVSGKWITKKVEIDQNNKVTPRFIDTGSPKLNVNEHEVMADKINALNTFVVKPDELCQFYTYQGSREKGLYRVDYELLLGKGIYGNTRKVIKANHICKKSCTYLAADERNNVVVIKDSGSLTISQYINQNGPFGIQGDHFFKVETPTVEKVYLYRGTATVIGVGNTQTVMSDFIEIYKNSAAAILINITSIYGLATTNYVDQAETNANIYTDTLFKKLKLMDFIPYKSKKGVNAGTLYNRMHSIYLMNGDDNRIELQLFNKPEDVVYNINTMIVEHGPNSYFLIKKDSSIFKNNLLGTSNQFFRFSIFDGYNTNTNDYLSFLIAHGDIISNTIDLDWVPDNYIAIKITRMTIKSSMLKAKRSVFISIVQTGNLTPPKLQAELSFCNHFKGSSNNYPHYYPTHFPEGFKSYVLYMHLVGYEELKNAGAGNIKILLDRYKSKSKNKRSSGYKHHHNLKAQLLGRRSEISFRAQDSILDFKFHNYFHPEPPFFPFGYKKNSMRRFTDHSPLAKKYIKVRLRIQYEIGGKQFEQELVRFKVFTTANSLQYEISE